MGVQFGLLASGFGVGLGFNPDGGVGRDHRLPVLFDAVHERFGVVTKAQRRLELVAMRSTTASPFCISFASAAGWAFLSVTGAA